VEHYGLGERKTIAAASSIDIRRSSTSRIAASTRVTRAFSRRLGGAPVADAEQAHYGETETLQESDEVPEPPISS
jgi:hypothetical protein